MTPAAPGLTPTDLDLIRDTLAAGRKPKVVFTESAGQVVGKVGQVVKLTDPTSSDDWIVVRFGHDELPFSPADLAIPSKAPSARRTEPPASPGSVAPRPVVGSSAAPAATVPLSREEPRMPVTTPTPSPASDDATSPNGSAKPGKTSRPKSPASLTVTLSYAEREWTVTAQQGTKVLAKPYVIKPVEALQMVALIDVPGVQETVEGIIEAERAEAETRALRLREELAEIETRLADLTSRS